MIAPYKRGASGERIELADPDATPIHLVTIAAVLSKICRWGGHCDSFYSVAAHSLHVSALLAKTHGRDGARVGLLHDAHEAYTGDCASPIKMILGDAWERFESRWAARVRDAFNLPPPHDPIWIACKHVDRIALATERERLMHGPTETDAVVGDWGAYEIDRTWRPEHFERDASFNFLWRATCLGLV